MQTTTPHTRLMLLMLAARCRYRLTDGQDRRLYEAALRCADHLEEKGEAFAADFHLSNDGYCESCAACGTSFRAERMHRLHGDAHCRDVQERLLYNAVLGAVELTRGGASRVWTDETSATCRHVRVDREHGHAFEAWKRIGFPADPSPDQRAELQRAVAAWEAPAPALKSTGQSTTLQVILPRQSVALLEFMP